MKLAAIAAFALVGLAVAQTVRPIPIRDVQLVGEVPAEWWTYITLNTDQNGQPVQTYTVPADQHLVIVNIRANGFVQVQGNPAFMPALQGLYSFSGSTSPNGARVAVPPGSVVVVGGFGTFCTGELWGYLEPMR
jgi:hypothetical protein